MPLTDTAIKALQPREKSYKASDEKGLYLEVTPSGGRLWRYKYRTQDGREKKLSFGSYPEVGLKDARAKRDEAKRLLANGIDPAEKKRHDKHQAKIGAANTFKSVALAFIARNRSDGLADATVTKRKWLLKIVERKIGHRPIADIKPFEVLEAVRPFETAKNHEKAHRALQFIGQVFRFGVANLYLETDPTRDLRGALAKPKPKHFGAILEPEEAAKLLRAIDGYEGLPTTQIALKLSPHLFVRPGELRRAEWDEIDFEKAIWRIKAEKMKTREEHVVPMSTQVISLFKEAHAITGHGKYVFPSLRSAQSPMSENTVNAAIRRMGYTGDEMTAHVFRAMASTLLNQSDKNWSPDAVERALAHKDKDRVRAAYNRGTYWGERVEMAQWWSDYLDELKARVTVG